ncbi:DUF1360 domain-containing protein [Paenibacillus endoradicis]|uniref:DUF1360 domain-containing protein n=1 Tax=Paenibacillus endoradicis TaxID=2972487 RepID=UPI0021590730|nr:DUF1360 domain-containing protein [Paenibacillus endoradicis]MCR8660122.1 DUF1360 domain-containing protein [Paenibacillus endoradicis]
MDNISWIQLVILILASFRVTHLIVYDNITWFLRAPFMMIVQVTDESGQTIQQVHIKGNGLRRWIGTLLVCHWCVGIWSALLLVILYYFVPLSSFIILGFAVAGMGSIIESQIIRK